MVLLLTSFNTFACSCAPAPYFFKAVTNISVDVNVVLHIKVLKNNDDGSIDAQVLEVFKGVEDASQIKIRGNNFCGPVLIGFDDGTEWIMPLAKLNEQNQYIHVSCLDSLQVKKLSVTGFISDHSEQTYTLESFRELWNLYYSALQVGREQCTTAALSNISGIWAGTVNSNWNGPDANYEDEIYLSIRKTTDNIAVIFLSSIEATKDLFSSTYLGKDLSKLDSYGVNAYFPDFNPVKQSLNYINTSFPIGIEIHEGSQSGIIHILCDTCGLSSVIVIRKIL